MNEEKYIEEQVGRRNPFTVPEGYFDTFADQLMASLPERQPRTKYVWLRPLRYAAAVVCVLAMGAMTWFALSSSPDVRQQSPVWPAASDGVPPGCQHRQNPDDGHGTHQALPS